MTQRYEQLVTDLVRIRTDVVKQFLQINNEPALTTEDFHKLRKQVVLLARLNDKLLDALIKFAR